MIRSILEMGCCQRTRLTRRGTIAVLAAVFLVVLLALVALAIDVGRVCMSKGQLQNAADAAALAAAGKLSDAKGNVLNRAREAARTYVDLNSVDDDRITLRDADIQFGRWDDRTATLTPLAGPDEKDANAVRVTCVRSRARGNPLQLCFASVIGSGFADIATTATARIKSSRCGLVIGLNKVSMSGSSHTDSYNSEQGSYKPGGGQKGHVCSNGDITMSGSATINGDAHPGENRVVKRSGGSGVTGSIKPLQQAISYPPVDPGDALVNNDNRRIPNSDNGKVPINDANDFTLSGGDAVSLTPGTYFFRKLSLSGGSTIRISGQTIVYVVGDCNLSGGSVMNQTSIPKNLQLCPMGSKCTISGASEFHGVVYAPQTNVVRSGSADFFGSIVAKELVLSGSGGIHADDSLDLSMLSQGLKVPVLVE